MTYYCCLAVREKAAGNNQSQWHVTAELYRTSWSYGMVKGSYWLGCMHTSAAGLLGWVGTVLPQLRQRIPSFQGMSNSNLDALAKESWHMENAPAVNQPNRARGSFAIQISCSPLLWPGTLEPLSYNLGRFEWKGTS